MAEVEAAVEIPAPLAEVWDFYFEAGRWPSWVDGFARVTAESGYPDQGGSLSWQSTASGRGAVSEQVLAHEPRGLHRISFRDPESEGELETRFEIVAGGEDQYRTRVKQVLSYELRAGGLFSKITDRLFVRAQMQGSLERSLSDLRVELMASRPSAADRARGGPAPPVQ